MLIDLDKAIAEEEFPSRSDRLFPYEIFLSHRRHDIPHDTLRTLRKLDVRISWDNDLDLRDRRVSQRVARAMRLSRYIVRFVSDQYDDSPWCRAEYLNGLWVERMFGLVRSVTLCQSPVAARRVPLALADSKTFIAPGDLPQLARFARTGNLLDEDKTLARRFGRVPRNRLSQSEEELTTKECLNLLEQRLEFWQAASVSRIALSEREKNSRDLSSMLGDPITELEVIFRDVLRIIVVPGMSLVRRENIGVAELQCLTRMAQVVESAYASDAHLEELRSFEPRLYELLLKPMLLAVECNGVEGAREAFSALCARHGSPHRNSETEIFLEMLTLVDSGISTPEQAVSKKRVDLWDAMGKQ